MILTEAASNGGLAEALKYAWSKYTCSKEAEGASSDSVLEGASHDSVLGGALRDSGNGSASRESVHGGNLCDSGLGGALRDSVHGGASHDSVLEGASRESVNGSASLDNVHGSENVQVSIEEQIEECLHHGTPLEDNFELDTVYCAAYNIKDYYMESGNPRQMRGASQLLNGIFEYRALDYLISNHHPASCQCYEGGSQTLILLPKGCGKEMAAHMEQLFADYCITAMGVAIYQCVHVNDLIIRDKFDLFLKNVYKESNMRRMLKFDVRPENDLIGKTEELKNEIFNNSDDECYVDNYALKRDPCEYRCDSSQHYHSSQLNERCERCRLRIATYQANLKEEPSFLLCASCAHKEIRGSFPQRRDFRNKCAEFCKEHSDDLFNNIKLKVCDSIRKTDDLKDSNEDIALLYADVNNLGGAGQYLHGLYNYIDFFNGVAKTVKEALYHSLIDTMLKIPGLLNGKSLTAKFEVIAVGGDDICVLLPGNAALFAATRFTRLFNDYWKKYKGPLIENVKDEVARKELDALSISVGVSVGRYTTPLAFMHITTEDLLKSAKNRSHKQKCEGKSPPYGAIDILSLKSDAQWATDLTFLRHKKTEQSLFDNVDEKNKKIKTADMTMRPFSLKEAEKFYDILNAARNISPHMLHNIDAVGKARGIDEGELFIDYLYAKADDNTRMALERVCGGVMGMLDRQLSENKKTGMYFYKAGNREHGISPWHDIVDLWDQGKEAQREQTLTP